MCDTYGQYLTMKAEIDAAMQEVIRSTQFIKSGKVLEFEKNLSSYLSTNVIACANGTDALQIAYMGLGLQPGDDSAVIRMFGVNKQGNSICAYIHSFVPYFFRKKLLSHGIPFSRNTFEIFTAAHKNHLC